MDHVSWLHDLEKDAENLELLSLMVQDITPAYDAKLQDLLRLIDEKQRHPINPGNRKIIIFTAFSDTCLLYTSMCIRDRCAAVAQNEDAVLRHSVGVAEQRFGVGGVEDAAALCLSLIHI